MTMLQILVLALIQGLTEFLPVSSSAHLILGSWVFSWPDQGLVFDVGVHLGTLCAVLIYFRRELAGMAAAWLTQPPGPVRERNRKLGLCIVLGSIPVLLVGTLAYDWVETWLRDVRVIAVATLGFGLALWAADRFFSKHNSLEELGVKSALAIGGAQVLALIPGASRSGVTITMGRMLGFSADAAARFSFLLSIPVIALAGAHGLVKVSLEETTISWQEFLFAMLVSAAAGWLCIAAFLALLRKIGLMPFIICRLVLGTALIIIVF